MDCDLNQRDESKETESGRAAERDVQTPVFTQTGVSGFPDLDPWRQIGVEEAQLAYDMTLGNELSGGTPHVRDFERVWRDWIGSKYAITVCNGTMALYSACFGLGVGPGDEVICPSYTWISSISGALMLGATPVFSEIDPETLMIDVDDLEARITPRTKAIIAVHLWGNVCDMDALLAAGKRHNIPIIEDCSHAHGATYRGQHVGSLGRVGCWSLQGSKPVSAGEGGVLATDDLALFERACLLGQVNRLGGLDLASERYEEHQPFGIGMKTRAHPLGIGIAALQLQKLTALNEQRHRYVEVVEAGLSDLDGLQPVRVHPEARRGGFYAFPVRHIPEESGIDTDVLVSALQVEGIPATVSPYPPLHRLPIFRDGFDLFTGNRCGLSGDYRGYEPGDLPRTEECVANLIFLPMMTEPIAGADELVIDAIHTAVATVQNR